MPSQPPKIAVLGTGAIVKRGHLPGLVANGPVEIHLAGRNTDRLAELAGMFPVHRTWQDADACLAQPGLDGVVIATPNFLHAGAALTAIDRGLPILLEKPLAHRIEAAREIVARAEAAGVPIIVNLHQRHRPSVRLMHDAIAEGQLGALRSISISMIRQSGIPGFGTWFTRKETAGGGVLSDLGPHILDLAFYLAGEDRVEACSGRIWADHGPYRRGLGDWSAHEPAGSDTTKQFDVDDRALVRLTLAGGVDVTCELAWAVHGADENRIRIVGEKGGFDYWPAGHSSDSPLAVFPAGLIDAAIAPDHQDLTPGWNAACGALLELVHGRSIRSDGPGALHVAEVINTVYTNGI